MKIAIIGGSGKMGRWFADFLMKEGQEITLTGRNEQKLLEVKKQLDVQVTTNNIEAIKEAKVILISVPIDNFEEVVKQLYPYLNSEQIVLDITSIKVLPVAVMHKYIKTGVALGIHPMFGPGAKDIQNQNFVLTPTNERETALAQKIKQYLATRGARVTLMAPAEHDEMMSVILGLSHFIAIVAADTLLSFDKFHQMAAIGGSTYKLLLTLAEGAISEDPEFYASLQMNLPKISEVEELFQKNSETWANIVKNKDKQEFARRMETLKDKLAKKGIDVRTAYNNIYKLLEK